MMKKLMSATTLMAGLFAHSALAVSPPALVDGSVVNFAGNMIATACQINLPDQNINLGVIDADVLSQADQIDFPFSIVLENCDTAVQQTVTMAYTGELDPNMPASTQFLANKAANPAGNVSFRMRTGGQGSISFDGSYYPGATPIVNGTTTMPLIASIITAPTTTMTPTPGDMLFSFTYKMKYE